MSVTLEKIYYTAIREYDMKLIAGKEGIWNEVRWIHIVENEGNAAFLKGAELVLFTGIQGQNQDELCNLVDAIRRQGACGIVFNIGPYIQEVPSSIIEYANSNDFPVFTLPWSVKLVEFSREFCAIIIRSEEEGKTKCQAFKGAILSPEDKAEYMPFFEKNTHYANIKYCMVKCLPVISFEKDEEKDYTKIYYMLRTRMDQVLNRYKDSFVVFRFDNYITMIIPETDRKEIDEVLDKIVALSQITLPKTKLYFAISKPDLGYDKLSYYFEKLSYMCQLMKKQNKERWFWENLGTWGIILSMGNQKSLSDFRKANIGPIEKYDKENGTEYCHILDTYLKQNGNMPEAAAECYLHRNTFSYHLKKIAEMSGCDVYSTEDRARLYLALRIKELMEI